MTIGRPIHQTDHMPLTLGDEHVEALTKAEFAHDIVRQVAEPVAHIPHHALAFSGLGAPFTGQFSTKLSDMQQHDILHTLEGGLGEGLAQDTTLASMHGLVDGIVGVVHSLNRGEGVVEIGLLKTLTVAVDVVKTAVGIDRDKVGCDADMSAVLLVKAMQPEMTITFETVVELDPWGDGGPEGTGDVAKRVNKSIVENVGDGLLRMYKRVAMFVLWSASLSPACTRIRRGMSVPPAGKSTG